MKNTRALTRRWAAPAFLCVLAALPAARAQEPARLEIGHLEKLADKAAEVVDVTLDAPMLKLASRFLGDKDPEEKATRDLIKDLKGIYVKSFQFDKEGEYSQADVDQIRAQLRAPAWSRIVGVRSKREHENAEVYLMGEENNIKGLAIIAAEPKELTVVNIVGPIDLDKLSRLEGHLGMPKLELEKGAKPRAEGGEHEKKD